MIFNDTEESCKVKQKLICGFKYDMRNLVNFHPTTQKSENFTSIGSFSPKFLKCELKITEELSFMTLNSDANLNKLRPYGFKNGMMNWANFH